jgi:hypothetical protein
MSDLLTAQQASAIAACIVHRDSTGINWTITRDAWMGLQRFCPHPDADRAVYPSLRIECGVCHKQLVSAVPA